MNILDLYYDKYIILEEMLLLYMLNENKVLEIEKMNIKVGNEIDIKKILEMLYNKGLIEINWNNNIISQSKDFEVKVSNMVSSKQYNDSSNDITIVEIDKIRTIINREIKPYELEQLQKWYELYKMETIIEAVYKAMLKNIDNFNYIEKILFNEQIKSSTSNNLKEVKVKKNFDFFK